MRTSLDLHGRCEPVALDLGDHAREAVPGARGGDRLVVPSLREQARDLGSGHGAWPPLVRSTRSLSVAFPRRRVSTRRRAPSRPRRCGRRRSSLRRLPLGERRRAFSCRPASSRKASTAASIHAASQMNATAGEKRRPQDAGDRAGGEVAGALHRGQQRRTRCRGSARAARAATAACSAVSAAPMPTPASTNPAAEHRHAGSGAREHDVGGEERRRARRAARAACHVGRPDGRPAGS